MSLLDGDLADIIGDALISADVPYPMVISRTLGGEQNPDRSWEPPTPVTETFDCLGFVAEYSVHEQSASIIQAGDVKIIVIANTLSITPEPNMSVQARGAVYRIVDVGPDPALATYQVQARR